MTGDEFAELLRDCPTLYHMAERGSWPAIQREGLLSASALLDLYEVRGAAREAIEAERRPESVELEHAVAGRAVIRDQKPMDDAGLRRCLQGGMSPQDWYRLLNGKVFFWLGRARLLRLLEAKPYRAKEHDVLEIDGALLAACHGPAVTLCAINSGATKPFPAARGPGTFLPIADYPYSEWRRKRPRGERVVEFAVERGVPDVGRFVRRVTAMRGSEALGVLYDGQRGPTAGAAMATSGLGRAGPVRG